MDNEQSERGKGREEQRVDMTFPEHYNVSFSQNTNTKTHTHKCKTCRHLKSVPIWKQTVCCEAVMIKVLV